MTPSAWKPNKVVRTKTIRPADHGGIAYPRTDHPGRHGEELRGGCTGGGEGEARPCQP